jgi:N-acetylglutamate synthase
MRARYVVRITPADVGQRVSIRARTHAGPCEPPTTDTVGILRSWTGGLLHVERRDGTVVQIPEADLLAARVIPG